MRKSVLILVFLLVLPIVFGALNLPTRTLPSITKPVPLLITKICNDGALRCYNNALQICSNNAWTVKEQCITTEYCNQFQGCVKKNVFQQPTVVQSPKDHTKTIREVTKPKIPGKILPKPTAIIDKQDLTKIRSQLPKAPTYVNCEVFREKEISFPEKTYEGLDDCQLLQNKALIDEYIKKVRETARECYELARENIGSFNGRIQSLIQEVNNVNEIEGRGITESADLMMQGALGSFEGGISSLGRIDENNQHKIRDALDALTSQVKNVCDAANRINGNVFNLCQDINKYISTGLDRHEPGLTKEEKKGFIKALQKQKNLANTNSNLARNNYKQAYKKYTLDDMIYVKGVENTCKKGTSSDYYVGYMSEAEKRGKGMLPISKDIARFRRVRQR